jgi:hypothetical protein
LKILIALIISLIELRWCLSQEIGKINKQIFYNFKDAYWNKNKWEDWSRNPLKQEAIKYYSFQEFLKN